jgi:hypothetical protein
MSNDPRSTDPAGEEAQLDFFVESHLLLPPRLPNSNARPFMGDASEREIPGDAGTVQRSIVGYALINRAQLAQAIDLFRVGLRIVPDNKVKSAIEFFLDRAFGPIVGLPKD